MKKNQAADRLDTCNTCGGVFADADDAAAILRQTLKNRAFLATVEGGEIVQECCEACAQDVVAQVEEAPA